MQFPNLVQNRKHCFRSYTYFIPFLRLLCVLGGLGVLNGVTDKEFPNLSGAIEPRPTRGFRFAKLMSDSHRCMISLHVDL